MRARRFTAAVIAACLAATTVVALPPTPQAAAVDDRVPEVDWLARSDDYIAHATAQPLGEGSTQSIMAFAERARRDPGFSWDSTLPGPEDFTGVFAKLAAYKDTGDFDINRFLFLLAGYGDDIEPDLNAALRERVLDFKYWWTEPTPEGIVDSQYYWTENHLIIFLANEYIAGQLYPTEVFSNSGMTGAEHMAHAEPRIRRWIALRARYGFSEWLSNVYWMEDLKGLLLLAEWADDPELAQLAADVLDLLFIELASHVQEGAFGATHGRSYFKDKMTALTEDTWDLSKLVLDDTAYGYQGVGTAMLLATAQRYRPPEVAREIASSDEVAIIRQHQSLSIDPTDPVDATRTANDQGVPYNDPMAWWGMGAQFPWQAVPLSIHLMETYDLWESDNFQIAAALEPIVAAATMDQLRSLASTLALQLNPGLLSEVNTYTWRAPEVMLSTAQDWRKGSRSEQAHIWQATLDANAQVFTGHPSDPVPTTSTYDGDGGYWSGEGAAPRAAQHENVNITIYAPQYAPAASGPLGSLSYLPYTHAYFPSEHFDEVVQQDGWTIGRLGDGYVALWSHRPTTWRTYTGDEVKPVGVTSNFELVAAGGPDNVWITEVGRAADWAGEPDPFAAFVAAVTATDPQVTDLGPDPADGFDVAYTSPSIGATTFGWDAPLIVDSNPIALGGYPRWDSPWTTVPWGSAHYVVTGTTASIDHDLTTAAAADDERPLDAPCESWFTDIELGHPFCADIAWLFLEGLAAGYSDGGFHPVDPVSRQAMAAFLYRDAGSPNGAEPPCAAAPFTDVPTTHAFCGEVTWLADEGLAGGFADGTFQPAAKISRQAMAAMLYRLAGSPDGLDPTCTAPAFPDVATAHPFCGEIAWLASTGITGGYADGGFHPGASVSRQATAAFLRRFDALP